MNAKQLHSFIDNLLTLQVQWKENGPQINVLSIPLKHSYKTGAFIRIRRTCTQTCWTVVSNSHQNQSNHQVEPISAKQIIVDTSPTEYGSFKATVLNG